MKLLRGKKLADKALSQLRKGISTGITTMQLDIILIGDDFGSKKYVQMKIKKADEVGINVELHSFESNIDEKYVIKLINDLNRNPDVTGIMVQLPLPKGFNTNDIVNAVDWKKDVDGLSATSVGKLFQNEECLVSATPKGVIQLLKEYNIPIKGRTVAMIGISRLVGIPMLGLLKNMRATILMCDLYTENIAGVTSQADIVISATGQPGLVKQDWIKDGSVVIDIGYTQDPKTGKVSGDVDFEDVKEKASHISPVPGGVGPMTVAMLLENVYVAYKILQMYNE